VLGGDATRTLDVAVDDREPHAGDGGERPCRQLAHLAGPHDHRPARAVGAAERVPEDRLDVGAREAEERGVARRQRHLAPHRLGDPQGRIDGEGEVAIETPRRPRRLGGVAHLAHHLVLAGVQGVERRRHPRQLLQCGLARVHVRAPLGPVGREGGPEPRQR
jgi:hypothetical protein